MIRELAFKVLCQRYSDEVFRYARSLLGQQADAEDATQEVLLRLWQNLPKVRLLHARGWLLSTTRHYCLDQIRRRSHPTTPLLVDEDLLEDQSDNGVCDPSQVADTTFRLEQARAALLKLPETLRSVFVLYEVNGLRYREIAETLEIPINSVRVNLFRARERLSKLMRKEELWTKTCKD
jgi:RNA polymerase sigma-70 factor (ECF subfamily)